MKLAPLLLCLWLHLAHSARILSVIPTASRSHYAAAGKILLELARRGHEVVSISPYEEKDAPEGFTWVQLEVKSIFDIMPEIKDKMNFKLGFVGATHRLWDFTTEYARRILQLPILKRFIETDRSHFDVVIAEEFYLEAFYAFAHKYKAPLVLFSSFGTGHYINEYMGNAVDLATVPHEFMNMDGEMTLYNRVKNLMATAYDINGRRYFSLEYQNELAKKAFGYLDDLPHVAELERNASLILVNSHFSFGAVSPTLTNIVEIAGIHIDEVKPLNKEIKAILDSATSGAVLFSLGSILDLASQPDAYQRGVLSALNRLKRPVLIKWNGERLPVEYSNVHAFKWLPQNDILAHPNIAAFVTHGGLHSILEAVHNGVPVVCTPFFGDQPMNCQKALKMGLGLRVTNITEENLYNALNDVLNDARFRANAQDFSKRFKDRIVPPMESAIYWIEYVIRHRGAEFLKSPRRNLYWYQIYYADFFALVVVCVLALYKIVRAVLSLFGKEPSRSGMKVKKN